MENERFPYAARTWDTTLAIREVDDQARTLHGTVVPYGEVTTVNDGRGPYKEAFARGAFDRSISQVGNKIPLYPQHQSRSVLPIAIGGNWEDLDSGLYGEFPIPRTSAGDDVLELVREGIVDSFSIGFRGIKARNEGGVTVRTEASLSEVSLVASPAYVGAQIAGIRSADLSPEDVDEWVRELTPATRQALVLALDGTGTPDTALADGTGDPTNLLAVRDALRAFQAKDL